MSTHETPPTGPTAQDQGSGSAQIQPTPAPRATEGTAIKAASGEPVVRSQRKEPAKRRPMTPGEVAVALTVLDAIAVVCILALTVFLASFAVRNSDFWMHLASGRSISQGEYKVWKFWNPAEAGADPFAYTTEGTYWANHSWFFDLLLYSGYKVLGGPALVVIKAALLVLLTFVLVQIREPGQRFFWPVVFTGIAIVAMSQRWLFQPAIVSYLFLGIATYLLLAPLSFSPAENGRVPFWRSTRRWWLLPVLFFFWVNLDGWFILGPAVLVLYLLGLAATNGTAKLRAQPLLLPWSEVQKLGIVLGVGLLATLVSPHHIFAYTLPSEISPTVYAAWKGHGQDWFFRGPWDSDYFQDTPFYDWREFGSYYLVLRAAYHVLAVAGLGSLLALGLVSVAGRRLLMRWEYFLPCVALFALSCFSARCIPFFVILMAPVAALTMYQLIGPLLSLERLYEFRFGVLAIRGLVIALLVVLGALAWPGWISPERTEAGQNKFQVQWQLEPEESFAQAAQQLREWRAQGTLPPGSRGFSAEIDFANYCSWFCPEEKVFCDSRLSLYDKDVLVDYLTFTSELSGVNQKPMPENALGPPPIPETSEALRKKLREYSINHIIRYDRKAFEASRGLATQMVVAESQQIEQYLGQTLEHTGPSMPSSWKFLWRNQIEWPLVYFDGRTTICAWSDPAGDPAHIGIWWRNVVKEADYLLDYQAQAYGREAICAPEGGTEWPSQGRDNLLDSYRHPPQARPLKADTAHGLLRLVYGEQHHFTLTDRQRVSAFARPALVAGAVGLGFGMQDPFRLVVEAAASDDAQVSRSHLPLLLQGSIQRAFSEGHTPPYLPLLAIRLARQAIRENPYDPSAYLALADAYLVLDATTIQGHLLADSNIYNRVRQTQRLAALEEVLLLDPKDWETHLLVAQIVERFSVDTALQHAESALEIMEKLPPHEAHPEVMETRIAGVEKYVERLRRAEEQSETQYVKSINKNAPLAFRARAAYEQYHLGEMALGLLADADQNPTTPEEKQTLSESINAEIAILLDLGRINHKDVVETVSDLNYSKDEANPWRQNPRFQYAMHAYRRCMAIGDYARAHGLLNQMELEQRVSNWREGTRVFINGLYARGPWPTLFLQDVATQRGSDSLRGNNGLGIIIPPPDKRPKGEDTKDLAAMEALTDPQFVVSLIVARLALAAPFTPGPLPWESLRLGELHVTLDDLPLRDKDGRITQVFRGLVRGFGNQYIIQADFSALRGMVALEQGNIELATKDLHKVFDYLYPEDERKTVLETGTSPMLDCHGRRVAMYWLRELENRKPR